MTVVARTGAKQAGAEAKTQALRQQRIWLVGKGRRKPEQLKGRGGDKGGALPKLGLSPKASQEPLEGTHLDLHF